MAEANEWCFTIDITQFEAQDMGTIYNGLLKDLQKKLNSYFQMSQMLYLDVDQE